MPQHLTARFAIATDLQSVSSETAVWSLTTICREAEALAEERQHVVLESIGNCADMRAGVDFKAVRDSVVIENGVQFHSIEPQPVLIADIHRDSAVFLEIADVLIDEGER